MHNVGKIDRTIRISLAILLAVLYFTHVVDGKLGNILIGIAGILALTSLKKCCPIYALLGLGTCGTAIKESETKIETKALDLD
jgi:hypothetical protein